MYTFLQRCILSFTFLGISISCCSSEIGNEYYTLYGPGLRFSPEGGIYHDGSDLLEANKEKRPFKISLMAHPKKDPDSEICTDPEKEHCFEPPPERKDVTKSDTDATQGHSSYLNVRLTLQNNEVIIK